MITPQEQNELDAAVARLTDLREITPELVAALRYDDDLHQLLGSDATGDAFARAEQAILDSEGELQSAIEIELDRRQAPSSAFARIIRQWLYNFDDELALLSADIRAAILLLAWLRGLPAVEEVAQ